MFSNNGPRWRDVGPPRDPGVVRITPGHPDYSRWAVNHGEPPRQRVVDPVPALADVELYDGTRALLEVHVVATGRGMVCIRQDLQGRDPWLAWVPAEHVRRR